MAESLAELMPDELPAGIAALPAQDRERLAATVVEAGRRQQEDLENAALSLLDFIPRMLRGAVKKAASR
ncbi:hypothetical protein [Nocardia sp. NPDC050710]|uniref:hypothetical protein n=1 Tax=Nocardia sp. NPDC050710 TaxID=3157220 RepID=UPI0034114B25